jgi:hypothetical protein
MLWEAFLALGRSVQTKTFQLCQARPRLIAKYLRNFDRIWMTSNYFGSRLDNHVQWTFRPPKVGRISFFFKLKIEKNIK